MSFSAATIPSGNVAVATIRGENLLLAPVRCEPMGAGFIIDVLPERRTSDSELILGVRIFRRAGAPRSLCLVRFSVGPATSVASITVRHA